MSAHACAGCHKGPCDCGQAKMATCETCSGCQGLDLEADGLLDAIVDPDAEMHAYNDRFGGEEANPWESGECPI